MDCKNKFNRKELDKYIKDGGFTVEKHPEANLYIYGYHQFGLIRKIWDDTNIHMRGLILDEDGNVVSRSFQKFFTFRQYVSHNTVLLTEGKILKITKEEKFKIYEKIDGTLTVLYWIGNKPYLATQRSFINQKAKKATSILYNKYSHVFSKLDKSKTYLFEAIYPEIRVVVDYKDLEDLFLIGIIDNKTGEIENLVNIGFPLPKDYTEELGMINNLQTLQALPFTNQEGFVLVYENGTHIKVKFKWFQETHKLVSQLINYKKAQYNLYKKLKVHLNLPDNKLTNGKVWKELNNNTGLDAILSRIPYYLLYSGAGEWAKNVAREYEQKKESMISQNPSISKNELKEKLVPEKIITYDINEEWVKPSSEFIIWENIKRISDSYD